MQPANFDGPGVYTLLCLDHVRDLLGAHPIEEVVFRIMLADAQSPIAGWDRSTRAFASAGADPAPSWSDFSDPLDAISARFRHARREQSSRFTAAERRALSILGLGEDATLKSVRSQYSKLVRRFHPDRNGGDRSHEKHLGEVIDAYQTLKKAAGFA